MITMSDCGDLPTQFALAGDAGLPKVSVVTVVFNGADYVEVTLQSVLGQTYPKLEYIVIDGGSTDGTVDIIRNYEPGITYWSSRPDKGIYDAMNIGLARASGDWVIFMNAGDVFRLNTCIEEVFREPRNGATVVYGAVEIRYENFSRVEQPGRPERLWQGMKFSHQSAFVDVRYHQVHPYNIANSIAADLEFFYQAYVAGERFVNSGAIIASVSVGGISETDRVGSICASRDAVCRVKPQPWVRLYYKWRMLDARVRGLAKCLLPQSVVKRIILLK
jgi:glycosyltransferase involved in cell wall biosynthesis